MKMQVKIDGIAYSVEIEDLSTRPIRVIVDGEVFEVWPETGEPEPASAAAPAPQAAPVVSAPKAEPAQAVNKTRSVAAPIPGVIIAISVKPGDTVAFGQDLLTLEAMKMKNIIRANRAGTVASVLVTVGDQVRQGQALIEYTD